MLAYAALIGVLGVAAIVVTRKVLPRLGVATGANRSMAVRETAYLGAKNAVYLLQVGGRRLLIGRCRESLTTLADVTDAFDDPREPAETEGSP
jgi:flagellar biogenesis protein FliO